ncbi:MAG: alpha/beta hydrolase-fold protein [Acidobacteriota bacterium]
MIRKLCTLLTVAVAAFAQTGTIEKINVHGVSLEGNLEGDPDSRDVFVYLPPSYDANRNQRYPVVYLLHGYGRQAETWAPFVGLPGSIDNGLLKGTTKEMIVVVPDANTKYGGSMYSSSPTTGDWGILHHARSCHLHRRPLSHDRHAR